MPSFTHIGNSKAKCAEPKRRVPVDASAAITIPNGDNVFWLYASGNYTVPALSAALRPGRMITLVGHPDASGSTIFTDTAYASTAEGKMHLTGALVVGKTTSVTFRQNDNGSWSEVDRSVIN